MTQHFMTRHSPRFQTASSAAAILTALFALAPLSVLAQGTDAQREACAPDAIKLCSDTIPDVPTTTACMKQHYSQLSRRCRIAFDAAAPRGEEPRDRVVTREPGAVPPPAADESGQVAVQAPERTPGLRSYEAHIRDICRQGLVDAFTCRNTLDLLRAGE